MHRLIYASRFSARFPRERQDQEYALNRIVHVSARNNQAAGLTGMLLLHRGHFLQALEGAEEAIGQAYEKILQDPRHEAVRLIALTPAYRREFGDFSMCARRVSAADDAMLEDLERRAADLSALDPAQAIDLLTAVRDTQARALLAAMA